MWQLASLHSAGESRLPLRGESADALAIVCAAPQYALQLAFEQTKARLQAEGLFAADLKRAIPFFPRRVGIVTSPTGAAIRDIINVISRRTRSRKYTNCTSEAIGNCGRASASTSGVASTSAAKDPELY